MYLIYEIMLLVEPDPRRPRLVLPRVVPTDDPVVRLLPPRVTFVLLCQSI